MMFDYFMQNKCEVYSKNIISVGAGDRVVMDFKSYIYAYIEPVDGEKLINYDSGGIKSATLLIYTKNIINTGEYVLIPENKCVSGGCFKIVRREFYKIPFFTYYKGFLVQTDENISI